MPTHHCRRASPLSRPPQRGSRAMVLPHSPARVWNRQSTTTSRWAARMPVRHGTAVNPRVPPTPLLRCKKQQSEIGELHGEPFPTHFGRFTTARSIFWKCSRQSRLCPTKASCLTIAAAAPPALCVEWMHGNHLPANADEEQPLVRDPAFEWAMPGLVRPRWLTAAGLACLHHSQEGRRLFETP